MNNNGFIFWEKKDLHRLIWFGILLAVLAGIVGFQIYRNRKWQEQLDKNSYTYWEGVIIRALNNPRSLSLADYQKAKQFGVLDRLLQERPHYKVKINRLIQIMEKKPGIMKEQKTELQKTKAASQKKTAIKKVNKKKTKRRNS